MHIGSGVAAKSFHAPMGAAEHHISVTASGGAGLSEQLASLEQRYRGAMLALGIGPETAVFRRLFVSDLQNQNGQLSDSWLVREDPDNPVAVSVVEQPPLPGGKVCMMAYHLSAARPVGKRRLSPRHLLVESGSHRHLWSTGLCAGQTTGEVSAEEQTRRVFGELTNALAAEDANLRDHCIRTWLYVKDVDVFYKGMVRSRAELFSHHGLTSDSHFIASTGIQGACSHQFDVVAMDAYSIPGIAPGRMSFLNDFSRMCPTKDYNVTFERGTRIAYGDRSHLFVSGTASIDHRGHVVHRGDVIAQLDHALGNVDAILRPAGAGLDDLMHLIVYLRDPTDHGAVDNRLRDRFPNLPMVLVHGPVCRPEWLIEVEGIAVVSHADPGLPAF
ncbi:MAG: Rid family hydrolase [Solirubrobacterales bacterium]